MKQLTVIYTFLSRFLMLFLNFGLVIFSTNFWGSEGKGIISIVIANITLIAFFSSIFCGSSISYFAKKFPKEQLMITGYFFSILIGIVLPFMINCFYSSDFTYYLVALSVVFSLLTCNISWLIGQKKINWFNLLNVSQYVLHFLFLLILIYGFQYVEIENYFTAQILCYLVLFIISAFIVFKGFKFNSISFSKKVFLESFHYGWKSQLSAFIQFLNYRLSYYFLDLFKGISSVGIYSIGVAFSEAIWVVSRSLSLVLYSEVINENDSETAIRRTKISLKFSFIITLVFTCFLLLIPESFFSFVFGKDFGETKLVILLLSPGIVAIGLSNIVGHYFAGINELRILNVKSLIGLLITIVGSYYLVPIYGISGACIVTSISYLVSSIILFRKFYAITSFNVKDFFISKMEFKSIMAKFSRK